MLLSFSGSRRRCDEERDHRHRHVANFVGDPRRLPDEHVGTGNDDGQCAEGLEDDQRDVWIVSVGPGFTVGQTVFAALQRRSSPIRPVP